jgi:hypothetical protein
MQFVMHEVFKVTDDFKAMPKHADIDVDTINAVLEEAGKFATDVIFPINISGDTEGCTLDPVTPCGHHAQGLQGGLRPVCGGRLAGAELATPSSAARACRWW